jgi:hypothetical protein
MSKLRTCLLTLATTASVFAASSASAASFEVWTGSSWSNNGIVHLIGPISINSMPCNADVTVAVVAGVANVVAAGFSGTSACSTVSAQNLPWLLSAPVPYTGANPPFAGAPTLTPRLSSVQITGVRILALGSYCPSAIGLGSIATILDSSYQTSFPPVANRFVFKTTLGPCAIQTRTTTAPYSLVANVPLRVVP